jgi:Arc/MetJ family transcription regulator
VIFKSVGDGRPYPEHELSSRDWAKIPPRQVRLDDLITTKASLDLRSLLSKESTFYGDLFPHVVAWQGELYLEDGLHRALRTALQQRQVMHARVLDLDSLTHTPTPQAPQRAAEPQEARQPGRQRQAETHGAHPTPAEGSPIVTSARPVVQRPAGRTRP